MKKLILSVVAASGMLFTTQSITAQDASQEVAIEETAIQQEEFQQIEVAELPAEVQQAVERDYAGAVIAEAYVKEKEGTQKFKLVVQTSEGDQKELFADAEGNWIDELEKKQ